MVILCFREGGKDFVHIRKNQWQIQDSSDGGKMKGCSIQLFWPFYAENIVKLKTFGLSGGASLEPL